MVYAALLIIIIGYILNNLSKKYILHNLQYKRKLSKSMVEIDEEFEISSIIENRKILPITFMQITERFPNSIYYKFDANLLESANHIFHKSTYTLLPYQRIKRTYKAGCRKRGLFYFYDVVLTLGDFLGLDTYSQSIDSSLQIIALPKPLILNNVLKPYGDYYGDISVKRWIIDDPNLVVGIREYTPFDPQKFIHWPTSLKSNKLMVKKFDFTSENTALVLLNIECRKPFWLEIDENKIEKCFSIARTVIEQLQSEGIHYAFVDNIQGSDFSLKNNNLISGYGFSKMNQILENLGKASFGIDEEFELILEYIITNQMNFKTTIIITPFVLESYIEYINRISDITNRAVLISIDDANLSKINSKVLIFTERSDLI